MVHRTSLVLVRLKRGPQTDLPLAVPPDQAVLGMGRRWWDRTLTPLMMLRLMPIQILAGNFSTRRFATERDVYPTRTRKGQERPGESLVKQ